MLNNDDDDDITSKPTYSTIQRAFEFKSRP